MSVDNLFSAGLQETIKKELTRYETKRTAILPILHAIQDECGWVQEKHIDALYSSYQLDRVQIKEVLTFYKAYYQHKPRKHPIQFCDNIVCCMMGAKEVMAKIDGHIKRLEEKHGENAPFEMIGVPCLGVCDQAPAMLVNKDRHHKVTVDNVDKILEKYAQLK
jgi:NADH:ubiquinone oxidoreductase subunit E